METEMGEDCNKEEYYEEEYVIIRPAKRRGASARASVTITAVRSSIKER